MPGHHATVPDWKVHQAEYGDYAATDWDQVDCRRCLANRPAPVLDQATLDEMNEAEQMGLFVGAAFGRVLAERDLARAALAEAVEVVEGLVEGYPVTSFAHSNAAVDRALEFIQRSRTPEAVDSTQTPDQED